MLKESGTARALLGIPAAAPDSWLPAALAFSPRPLLPDISELWEFKLCPKHSHQSPCGGKRWGHEARGHCPAHVLLHFLFGFVAFEANKNHSKVETLLMSEIINQQVCWMHSVCLESCRRASGHACSTSVESPAFQKSFVPCSLGGRNI